MAKPILIPEPTRGVRPDLDPENVDDDALVSAENMIYRNGDFKVRPGLTTLADLINQRPLSYFQYQDESEATHVVMGTDQGWWLLGSSTWADITDPLDPLTGASTDFPIFRTFPKSGTNYLLGANGKDSPKKYSGSGTYAAMGGSPPNARCMAVLYNRCVLANLTSGANAHPGAIDVSNDKDFDAGWGAVEVTIVGSGKPIRTVVEMSDFQAAIFQSDDKEGEIHQLVAQAGSTPFRVEFVKSGTSCPASQMLTAKLSDGSVLMVGRDGLVSIFDGASVNALPYWIQRQIITSCNPEKFSLGWCAYDSDRRETWIIYPLTGSNEPNGGVLLNMVTMQVYPIRFDTLLMTAGAKIKTSLGMTIGDLNVPLSQLTQTIGELGSSSAVRRMAMGASTGQTYQDLGFTDNGSAIPFSWETPVRGSIGRFATVGKIRHRFKPALATQNVSVQLGKRNEAGDVSYGTAKTIDISSTRRKITGHRVSAEYFGLKFSGNASQEVSYQGSAIEATPRGKR